MELPWTDEQFEEAFKNQRGVRAEMPERLKNRICRIYDSISFLRFEMDELARWREHDLSHLTHHVEELRRVASEMQNIISGNQK
jgi:FtsZ-binding cell division protein ZapB